MENIRNKLVSNCKTHTVPIMGIVDHTVVHDDRILHQHVENSAFFTNLPWINTNNALPGGVNLIISRRAKSVQATMEL